MSVASLLSIARTAIAAQDAAVQTASHNISNAETPGYSRQRAELTASTPVRLPQYTLGTGVRVSDVSRSRDALLDAGYRSRAATAAGTGLRRDLLQQIEGALGEPSDTGLAATLDQFWGSWSDLAADPLSTTARGVVRQRGQQLADMLNGLSSQLADQRTAVETRLGGSIDQLNALGAQVAQLNTQIVAAESGGQSAPDLRDARDRAIDAMAQITAVRVLDHDDGSVAVVVGTNPVVDGPVARPLAWQTVTVGGQTRHVVGFAGAASGFATIDGALGAMVGVLDGDLAEAAQGIRTLAGGVVSATNSLYAQAVAQDGTTGYQFFDAATFTSGGTVALASDVADPADILVGRTMGATGDTSIALDMAALRDDPVPLLEADGSTRMQALGSRYADVVSSAAVAAHAADGGASAAETAAAAADTRRQSVSGVSTDEELTQLMRFQHAYAAAARIVNVADEMAKTILQMI